MAHYGVLLRGLPFDASINNIIQFFSSINLHKSAIDMIHMYNGRFSGLAYVKLRNHSEVKLATDMDQQHIGARYIDVLEINEEKLEQIKEAAISGIGRLELHRMCASEGARPRHDDRPRPRSGGRGGGGGGGGGGRRPRERSRSPLPQPHPRNGGTNNLRTRFAYITGFPPETLYKGVRQFFDGCLIGNSCVHLFRGENDRFRGDGYIEFANADELKKGLKRNNNYFQGTFRINIEPCLEQEVNDMKPYMMDRSRPSGRGRGTEDGFPSDRGGYRSREEYERVIEPRGSIGRGGRSPRERDSRYGDYGDRWTVEYRHSDRSFGQPLGVEHNSRYSSSERGRRGGEEFKREYELSERDYGYVQPLHYGGHPSAVSSNSSGSASSREKKTLRVQGLSPSTGISDIVTFFRNYGVEFEGVRVQCHDDGSPNGRAFVTFPSERIASAALHDMNRRLLKNAYVELTPVNY